jgi:hypothetical protein
MEVTGILKEIAEKLVAPVIPFLLNPMLAIAPPSAVIDGKRPFTLLTLSVPVMIGAGEIVATDVERIFGPLVAVEVMVTGAANAD